METYLNPTPVAVAMIPVWHENKTHLLTIKRNNKLAFGGIAMPGGYVDNNLGFKEGAIAEAQQEVNLSFLFDDLKYYDEFSVKASPPQFPKSTAIIFYVTPVLEITDIDFTYRDKEKEVAEINMVYYDAENSTLRNMQNEQLELCFPSHQKFAVRYLQEIQNCKIY